MFLSADKTQGNLQGMDPYGYVNGNPETQSDPTGRVIIGEPGGGSPPQAPPVDNWWNDPPSWHIPPGYGPSHSGTPHAKSDPFDDPWKWKPILALVKGALGLGKFYIDASVLNIAAAKYADLFASLDTYLPAIDDPTLIALLTGLSEHPSGVFQSQLPGGMKALAEGFSGLLGLGLNVTAGLFSYLDLRENLHNHDYWSAGVDVLNMGAVASNILGWILDNEFLSALGSRLALVAFAAQAGAFAAQLVMATFTWLYNNGRSDSRRRSQSDGGGGFPPFPPPPLIPNFSDPYA